MKKLVLVLVVVVGIVSIFLLNEAKANFACTGKPSVHMSLQSGTVSTNIGYGEWYLCSLREEQGGIAPETCGKIYNGLLLAEATNQKVTIYFQGATNCASLGSWQWPSNLQYFIDFLAGPAN